MEEFWRVNQCLIQHLALNHLYYAVCAFGIGKLQPPVIPFMPLLLKGSALCFVHRLDFVYDCTYFLDTTFINEGNETYIDGLVNFEKMVSTLLLRSSVAKCIQLYLYCYVHTENAIS